MATEMTERSGGILGGRATGDPSEAPGQRAVALPAQRPLAPPYIDNGTLDQRGTIGAFNIRLDPLDTSFRPFLTVRLIPPVPAHNPPMTGGVSVASFCGLLTVVVQGAQVYYFHVPYLPRLLGVFGNAWFFGLGHRGWSD